MPQWEQVEFDVLRALSIQVKYLTPDQVARGWFSTNDEPLAAAEALLELLHDSDLLERETIEVYDIPQPTEPLLQWQPGDSPPTRTELAQLAEKLADRWSEKLRAVLVARASREAANCFGAATGGDANRSSDWSHDLFISEVFLLYRRLRPEVQHWLGEAFVPKLGLTIKNMKDPDAFLMVEGQIERIVEIGGKYTVEHLQALHEHCAGGAYRRLLEFISRTRGRRRFRLYDRQKIPYEIW